MKKPKITKIRVYEDDVPKIKLYQFTRGIKRQADAVNDLLAEMEKKNGKKKPFVPRI
jgi:hypothetical protein